MHQSYTPHPGLCNIQQVIICINTFNFKPLKFKAWSSKRGKRAPLVHKNFFPSHFDWELSLFRWREKRADSHPTGCCEQILWPSTPRRNGPIRWLLAKEAGRGRERLTLTQILQPGTRYRFCVINLKRFRKNYFILINL